MHVECIPNVRDQDMMLVRASQHFSSISYTWEPYSSFQSFKYHPRIPKRLSLFCDEQMDISQSGTLSHPSSSRTSSNCLSHTRPACGCPNKFRSRGTTGSSMLDHDFGHVCRGRRVHIYGHSDFGILSNFGASSILT